MIGLDTNVLVRYLVRDDREQSELAKGLIEALTPQSPGYVSLVSLVELTWVLARSYGLDRADVTTAVEALLDSREIVVDRADTVRRALTTYRATNADLADCLIERGGSEAGCEATVTFDVRAARDAGMKLLRPTGTL